MKKLTLENVNRVVKAVGGNSTPVHPSAKDRKSTKSKSAKPVKKQPKLTLNDMRQKPVETQYFVVTPDCETVIDGPLTELDKAVSRTINTRRSGDPCRLIAATVEVLIPEHWLDNEEEAIANDTRG